MCNFSRHLRSLLLALFCLGAVLQAQSSVGFQGIVVDAADKPMEGVAISIQNDAGRELFQLVTDSAGKFFVQDLAAGTYQVVLNRAGFRPLEQTLSIIPTQGLERTFRMELATQTAAVTVSAGRGSLLEDLDVNTTTLTRQQLEASAQTNVDQVLNKVPGVFTPQVPANQIHPTAQIVSIRGFGNSFGVKTLVLVDGIPINDGYFRTIDWSQAPTENLDRIEVIRGGGATSLWGNLAMGGVINMMTREPAPKEVRLNLSYGNYNTFTADAAATILSTQRWRMGATYNRAQTDGYHLIPSQYRNPRNSATASHSNNGALSTYFTPSDSTQAFLRLSTHDNREDGLVWDIANNVWKRHEVRGGLATSFAGGLISTYGWWNRVVFGTQNASPVNNNGGAYNFNQPNNGYPYVTQLETARPTSFGGSVLYERNWQFLKDFKIGTDFRNIRIEDHNNLYSLLGENTAIFDAHGIHRFQGVFMQGTFRPGEGPLDITFGLRGDFWQTAEGLISGKSLMGELYQPLDNQSYQRFNPRLGIKYSFLKYFALRGAIYRNFSAPGMNQMYRSYAGNASFNNSSPGLIPETNSGQEAGFDFRRNGFDIAFTIFSNRINGYIDYPLLCTTAASCLPYTEGTGLSGITSVRQYLNVGKAVIKGGELLTGWQVRRDLRLDFGLTKTTAQLTETLYPSASPIRSQIGQVPEWMISTGAMWSPLPRLDLSIRIKSWPTYWNNTAHSVVNDGATITDVYANFRLNHRVSLYGMVQNAGNIAYLDQGSQGTGTAPYRGQPLRINAGVRLNLGR